MSVSFAQAVVDGLRHNGIVVHFWQGWERQGNGMSSAYQGLIQHHTASNYGSAFQMLVSGRSDLSGPLCNSAGNADGSITIIAAHPANHAGASGGRSMGPLTITRSFNKYVWGHEIVYPGDKPMTAAQDHAAKVLGGVIGGILRRPNAEWVRAHAETSITGKWDPGYAPGKTIDMNAFRAGIWPALNHGAPAAAPAPKPAPEDDLTPEQDALLRNVHNELLGSNGVAGRTDGWGTLLGKRTVVAMMVELYNALLAEQPSTYPGSKVKLSTVKAIRDDNGLLWQLPSMISAVGQSDPDAVAAALRPVITEVAGPVISAAVRDALGADNEAQADEIVDRIANRLGNPQEGQA